MRTRWKVCGVRSPQDLQACVAAGVDAIGFNCYPRSPRYVEPAAAAELVAATPLWVDRVALLVAEPVETVRRVATQVGASSVQIHGRPTTAELAALAPWPVIMALPADDTTLDRLRPLLPHLAAVLLDAAVPGQHGGTGQLADWTLAATIREALAPLPVILAGGLRPENVAAAVTAVRPYAVDVASGVESAPGVKDATLLRQFAAALRSVG
ncbi:MAG: phosphoribosylanthranilate isomerase [Fimbriimonadaceae bacterium]|nr:phosphoribosylanthranilate isomerase [Fimbriimonadaceae bacterium]